MLLEEFVEGKASTFNELSGFGINSPDLISRVSGTSPLDVLHKLVFDVFNQFDDWADLLKGKLEVHSEVRPCEICNEVICVIDEYINVVRSIEAAHRNRLTWDNISYLGSGRIVPLHRKHVPYIYDCFRGSIDCQKRAFEFKNNERSQLSDVYHFATALGIDFDWGLMTVHEGSLCTAVKELAATLLRLRALATRGLTVISGCGRYQKHKFVEASWWFEEVLSVTLDYESQFRIRTFGRLSLIK
jgi:hypothetical protein